MTIKPFNYEESFERLQKRVNNIQKQMTNAITTQKYYHIYDDEWRTTDRRGVDFFNGHTAKTSLIRSQQLISELHEFVKEEMIAYGIDKKMIYPSLNEQNPEIALTGFFKQKKQDITLIPNSIKSKPQTIDWGLVQFENKTSQFGQYKESRMLSVNVRSQLSSLGKNYDTLFERMIAEPVNLHLQFPKLVTGELYLIPVYEYLDSSMNNNEVKFSRKKSNIPVYMNFFSTLNNYEPNSDPVEPYKYNKAGLLIVDFSQETPKIYDTTEKLIQDNLIEKDMVNSIDDISPVSLVHSLLVQYENTFDIN